MVGDVNANQPTTPDESGQPGGEQSAVSMSARAARRIAAIMAQEAEMNVLRLSVNGGGCSGFSYEFKLEGAPVADDLVIDRDGARVVIDQTSLPYLTGSEIDFVDDLIGQSFQVKNPNATASCGCGTSFSI
ncbi:probable iron binding protein from the HesB_IscA_SufA family [hydrothermal vent metagenome]|uniref:Probable iron binding protein from the HesB_IscA_SufA family n=1 Tax=hydrothermal vent metagenome TaxID=652676 RepID=A0A3B0T158_9ZZZZ